MTYNIILLSIYVTLITTSSTVLALSIDKTQVPGGIAVVDLSIPSTAKPKVFFKDKKVMLRKSNYGWQAIVGIPLSVSVNNQQHLDINTPLGVQHKLFKVYPRKYLEEHITITNQRKVTPHADDLSRISKERARITNAYATFNDAVEPILKITQPVSGRYSSPFGLQRFYNGIKKNFHTGLDIAAPIGTTIIATSAGKVIETGDFFFIGNVVIVDHGHGFITSYAHMDTVVVKKGQKVTKGEKLGTIGMTGRVTGPHLHWSVILNDTLVDPELAMQIFS